MKRFLVIALALFLAGCGHPLASVKNTRARYEASASADGQLAAAEQEIIAAQKLQKREPLAAIGKYLNAAEAAAARLREQPKDAAALRDYNFALARVFSTIREEKIDAWSQPLAAPGYVVTHRKDTRALWNPADYEFVPCDELTVGGTAFHERARRVGLGAPLLAIRRTAVNDFKKQFLRTEHIYYGVTAVATFQGNRCEISLEDPLAKNTVALGGRSFPLAGDFSTAVATFLVREKPQKLGLTRLLHPGKYQDTALLYRLQPYNPNKIPVVFVHGLQDTSATWMPMFNALLDDPEIRDAYQFWFFTYPSGYPFPYSAALLRHDLDRFDKAFPGHKPILMVGHSMGGLLTRLMVSSSNGDEIWRELFEASPADTPLPQQDKELLASALVYQHRRDINRAVFLSTPHRGSEMASNWIGKIATKLVRLPKKLVLVGADLATAATESKSEYHLRRMPNAIDTLSPKNNFVVAMNKRPPADTIPYHQIVGDRGRGNSPDSSDGVVAYWSSHLDGARSTKIVPSGHGTHQNPEGIAEIRRILKLHLRNRSATARPAFDDMQALTNPPSQLRRNEPAVTLALVD
ncbi:MAG TPA: alpha/beta fold hydrolase [Chthoniobacterales bacterium]|nr:alpha/beta fold hydrolase [Chthoniobacterales bacterium]